MSRMGVLGRVGAVARSRDVVRVTPDAGLVAGFDYADAFSTSESGDHPAREWATAALAGADLAGGAFARGVWHGVLGFDLAARGTPQTLVGWRIEQDEPGRFVLGADGRLMAGRMVFALGVDRVTWTTALRFHRPAARRTLAVAAPVHRPLARRCLQQAHTALSRAAVQ